MTIAEAIWNVRNNGADHEQAIKVLVDYFSENDGFCVVNHEMYVLKRCEVLTKEKSGNIWIYGWKKI